MDAARERRARSAGLDRPDPALARVRTEAAASSPGRRDDRTLVSWAARPRPRRRACRSVSPADQKPGRPDRSRAAGESAGGAEPPARSRSIYAPERVALLT